MLGSDLKPGPITYGDGAWVVRELPSTGRSLGPSDCTQSPEQGVDVVACQTFSRRFLSRSQLIAPAYRVPFCLRSRLLYFRRRGGITERLIDLATHPKSMQQDRQLPRYRYRGSLLRVLPPALAQSQSVPS